MAGLTREQRAEREANQRAQQAASPGLPASANREDDDGGDDRVVRSSAMESRGERGHEVDASRANPTEMTDFEKLIEDEFDQSALPNPPALPGFHLVWLTSTSQYDSIQKRQRLGYQPVKLDEMPGFDPSNGQRLERFPGFVTCNEMVLFKIEEARYQAIMKFFHHKKPLEEEEGILSQIDRVETDSSGKNPGRVEGDGIGEIAAGVAQGKKIAPTFS